jgi:hypothetical protein
LPLCPTKIKVNQTSNGISISWTYPKETPIKIEYFQIYFREITASNAERSNIHNNEWKTTESIGSGQNSYFIDESDLDENHSYEFQLVSFSLYSKSLPSPTFKFKYSPKVARLSKRPNNQYDPHATIHSSLNQPNSTHYVLYNYLLNITQLDMILIAIFLILIFILVICITAFVVYKRSYRSLNSKKRNSKNGRIFFDL